MSELEYFKMLIRQELILERQEAEVVKRKTQIKTEIKNNIPNTLYDVLKSDIVKEIEAFKEKAKETNGKKMRV